MWRHWGTRLAERLARRLPRRTVRFRLTVLYGGLFLLAGIAVLALTYLLVAHATEPRAIVENVGGVEKITRIGSGDGAASGPVADQIQQLRDQADRQHASDLHQLLVQSGIALGVATLLAFVAGWLMAGRVLRPLRVMTSTAQRISQHNLHERLALTGPRDEIKDLADTIDGLLARLQSAFDTQRRFVANVSHELRTPLTWGRALVEVSLADPDASTEALRGALEELLVANKDQERLIEALLTLATSERGLDRRDPVNLAALAHDALAQRSDPDTGATAVHLDTELDEAWTSGSADLVKRLISNLIDNAHRHNHPGGQVRIRTGVQGDRAVLSVSNTGPTVPADQVDRLVQPFQRLTGERAAHPDGHGLGLSIVAAIATAHDAQLTIQPGASGGLDVRVSFAHLPASAARPRFPASPTHDRSEGCVSRVAELDGSRTQRRCAAAPTGTAR